MGISAERGRVSHLNRGPRRIAVAPGYETRSPRPGTFARTRRSHCGSAASPSLCWLLHRLIEGTSGPQRLDILESPRADLKRAELCNRISWWGEEHPTLNMRLLSQAAREIRLPLNLDCCVESPSPSQVHHDRVSGNVHYSGTLS